MGIQHTTVKVAGSVGLAADWNDNHIVTGHVNFSQYEAQYLLLHNAGSGPVAPAEGQLYYNTTAHSASVWDGTRWHPISSPQRLVVATDGSGDYDNIKDAVDAMTSPGGIIYVKPGDYTVAAMIDIDVAGVSLIGSGPTTRLMQSGSTNIIRIKASSVTVSSLQIVGDGTGSSARVAVQVFLSPGTLSHVTLSDINVTSYNGTAFLIATSTDYLRMHRCYATDCAYYAFSSGSSALSLQYAHITDFVVLNNCTVGGNVEINIVGLVHGIFSGTVIHTTTTSAIQVQDSHDSLITNSSVYGATVEGIRLHRACSDNQVSNNIINCSLATGIIIDAHGGLDECFRNHLVANHLSLCTTTITDGGTGTTSQANKLV